MFIVFTNYTHDIVWCLDLSHHLQVSSFTNIDDFIYVQINNHFVSFYCCTPCGSVCLLSKLGSVEYKLVENCLKTGICIVSCVCVLIYQVFSEHAVDIGAT